MNTVSTTIEETIEEKKTDNVSSIAAPIVDHTKAIKLGKNLSERALTIAISLGQFSAEYYLRRDNQA